MCGICGLVYTGASPVDLDRFVAMREALQHRGPDDAGVYVSDEVMLGSRRLSIVDLSANGHMPMSTPDGRYTIAYNGEVYNYRELRPALEAKGYKFRSNTDTEVLLYLYVQEGPDMLHWLNGMFTIAIWDAQERTLFLARDRLGVKPVYYAQSGDTLYFASEQKALFAAGVCPEFDPATWEELLCFRYVAGERTPFKGVRRLLPGHYLRWQSGRLNIRRWWNLSERARLLREAGVEDAVDWLRQTFDSAVKLRTIADVPLGVLLSGGLDSSCVAASLGAQGVSGLSSFTVRFEESGFDEGPIALTVAEKWGLKFHEYRVATSELPELIRFCSWLNDEPLAHANDPHLYAISRYAKPIVTVLLSGEGSDETLGGYVRYRPLRHLGALERARPLVSLGARLMGNGLAGSLGGRLNKLDRFLRLGGRDDFVMFDACDVLPADLRALGVQPSDGLEYRRAILGEAKALYPGEPMRQAMYLDQHTFLVSILDRNDRTTMGASIECRVPFLDYRIVEGLAALPSAVLLKGRKNKSLLRDAFSERLPEAVLRHRKWGFGVPWTEYFRKVPALRDTIANLADSAPVRDGPFDTQKIRAMTDAYLKGEPRHHAIIRQLFFIAVWHESCVRGGAQEARRAAIAPVA